MAAEVRRRPARFIARAPIPLAVILPLSVVLTVAGCSPGDTEPEPLFASSSMNPSTAAPATLEGTEGGDVRLDGEAAPPALSYDGDVATGLTLPWSVVVLADGDLLVSDRETGEITRVGSDGPTVVGSIPEAVAADGEGGLLGLALPVTEAGTEPDALYAYYTSGEDNRVVRLPWTDGEQGQLGELGEPEPILTGIPKARIHNGGRIAFGPDGHLYVGTGDAGVQANAQDPASLGGKILRITADGDVPAENPTPDSPVYSLGHRNVQGLAWDSSGRLWATEFGPEVDDELNLVESGGNYGWPEVTGAPRDARFIDAQVVWPSTASSSPSGMAIVEDIAYIGGLRGQRLWQVPLDGGAAGQPVSHFDGEYGRLRDVTVATDGSLLVATNEQGGARLLRVERQAD